MSFKYLTKMVNLPRNSKAFSNIAAENHVITRDIGDKGILIVNRPAALNAINLPMVKKIYSTLKDWESKKALVIVKGINGKAFSVGGDLKQIIHSTFRDNQDVFKYQHITKMLVTNYKIPLVSFVDGVVIGSASALSFLGQYCIITERAIFSMPEIQIGLIPDGGSSYFLPRLRNHIGWYLALTGHNLKGSDIINAGLSKYYCESAKLEYLEEALLNTSDTSIRKVIENFTTTPQNGFSLDSVVDKINHCFSVTTMEGAIERLKKDDSKWARETLRVLNKMCPSSLKITLKELELGKDLNMLQCSEMELRLAINCLKHENFQEGVRAMLIDKDNNPKWNPPSLSDVSNELVESYFAELPEEPELQNKL